LLVKKAVGTAPWIDSFRKQNLLEWNIFIEVFIERWGQWFIFG
jgi:hypothetical protein